MWVGGFRLEWTLLVQDGYDRLTLVTLVRDRSYKLPKNSALCSLLVSSTFICTGMKLGLAPYGKNTDKECSRRGW